MSGSNFEAPEWLADWQAKYAPILVNGLTDGPTYVRLVEKELATLTVDLAFRPLVLRASENVLFMGGKLSVFPRADSVKVEPTSDKVMVNWLLDAFPKFEYSKVDPMRVGTMVMAAVVAPVQGKKVFKNLFSDSKYVDSLLDYIEATGDVQITNRKLAARAIKEAFMGWLEHDMFIPGEDEHAKVSLSSEGFSQGANVIPILSKQVAKIEAPKESA